MIGQKTERPNAKTLNLAHTRRVMANGGISVTTETKTRVEKKVKLKFLYIYLKIVISQCDDKHKNPFNISFIK